MISFKKSGYTAIGCVASLVDRYKKKSEWESSEVYSLTFQVQVYLEDWHKVWISIIEMTCNVEWCLKIFKTVHYSPRLLVKIVN